MKIASPQPSMRLTLQAAADLLWPWNPDHHHCQIGPGSIYIFLQGAWYAFQRLFSLIIWLLSLKSLKPQFNLTPVETGSA